MKKAGALMLLTVAKADQPHQPLRQVGAGKSPLRWTLLVLLALGGAFSLFVLPFLVPTGNDPVFSTAWACGADNRAAYVCLALISIAACFVFWVYRWLFPHSVPAVSQAEGHPFGMAGGWLVACAVVIAIWSLGWGAAILHSNLRVGETNYFLEQTRNAAGIGLPAPMRIYKDLDFPYGPVLLNTPVWLWDMVGRFGVSAGACYVVTLACFNVAGFLLLLYVLARLPLKRWSRGIFALCCAFVALHPLFGPNYSLLKFLWPVAVLVFAMERIEAYRRATVYVFGYLITLLISPELAVGLGAAILVSESVHAVRSRSWAKPATWLILLSPVVGSGLFFMVYGSAFLHRLQKANSGALTLVIQPMPDVLILLVVVVWLAPFAVSVALRHTAEVTKKSLGSTPPNSALFTPQLIVALFVLSLGMLPGALGRADPLHVFFNGLPFCLLGLVAVAHLSRRSRLFWLAAMVLLSLQVQADNYHFYARSLRQVLLEQRHPEHLTINMTRLIADTNHEPVSTPFLYTVPLSIESALRANHMLQPGRAPGVAEIWDASSERTRIQQFRENRWALTASEIPVLYEHAPGYTQNHHVIDSDGKVKHFLRRAGGLLFGFPYQEKRTPYGIGSLMQQELAQNWRPVDKFGDLVLYQRLR